MFLLHCNESSKGRSLIHERINQGEVMKTHVEIFLVLSLMTVYLGSVVYLFMNKSAILLSLSYSISSMNI